MASKLGSIYVEVRADKTQFQQDMTAIRSEAKKSGRDIGVALGDGITGTRAERGIKDLSTGLMGLANTAKVPASAFKTTSAAIASGLKDVARQIGITEKEYAALNEKMLRSQAFKQAESNLRNISRAAGLSTTETKRLAVQMGYTSKEAKEMANNVTMAKRSVNLFGDSVRSLTSNLLGLGAAYAMAYKAKELGTAVFESGQKALVAENAYKAITGSVKNANKEFEFLRETSDKLGLNFYTLRDSYKGFLAAAQNSKIPMEEVRNIFASISNAGAVMGLSNERMSLSFLALEQMMSKGKVSMEELRRQLGDNLPGAFQIGAKAMGMTVEAFDKAVSAGEVYADDFLPKFRVAMEEAFQGTIADSVKAVNKLTEQWETMKIRMSSGGFMDSISNSMKTLTETLSDEKTIQSLTNLANALGNIAESAAWTIDKLGSLAKITMEAGDYWGKFFYEPLKVANKELHSLNGALRGIDANLKVLEKSNRMGSERAKALIAQKDAIETQIMFQERYIKTLNEVLKTEAQQAQVKKQVKQINLPLDPLIARLEKEKAEVKKTMAGIEEDVLKRIEKTDAAKLESLKKELAFVQKYGADKLNIISQLSTEITDIEKKQSDEYIKEQEKQLKALQKFNLKKYQTEIQLAKAISKDTWIAFDKGQKEALKDAEKMAEAKDASALAFNKEIEEMERWLSIVESGLTVQEADLRLKREIAAEKLSAVESGISDKEIVSYLDMLDAIEKIKKEGKEADDILKKWEDIEIDFSFGDNDPFSKILDSINDIIEASEKQAKVQEEINKLVAMGGEYAEEASKMQLQASMDAITGTMDGYSNLFSALSNLYKEDSKERKAMHELEKGFALAEIAVNTIKAVTLGVVAVVNAMSAGDPYTAIARGLAVAATVASALSQIDAQFSMGGGGGSEPVKAENRVGTVLGDSGATSDSIKNIEGFFEDMHIAEYTELMGIHDEMKDLNTNITGLVSSLFRGGIGFTAEDMGIDLSFIQNEFADLNDKVFDQLNFQIGLNQGQKYFDPLTTVATAGAEKIGNWLASGYFGGGVSSDITSQGITAASGVSIGQLSEGTQIDVQKYADIRQTTEGSMFGMIDDGKVSVTRAISDLEGDFDMLFTQIFKDLGDSFIGMADILGADINTIRDYVFEIGFIDLKNLETADEIDEALNAAIAGMTDVAATTLFGELIGMYQKVGEGMLETLIRVTTGKVVVVSTLEKLGSAFEISDIPSQALAFTEGLIEMAGGLEEFIDITSNFYDKFFSDAEKQADRFDDLTAIFGSVNEVLPDTADAFKELVVGLDLTTQSGMEASIALMNSADMAAEYFKYLEDASNELVDSVESARSNYRSALNDALSEAQSMQDELIQNFEDAEAQLASVRAAWDAKKLEELKDTLNDESKIYSDSISAMKARQSELMQLADQLRDYQFGLITGSDSPLLPGQLLEAAKSQFANASPDRIIETSQNLLKAGQAALTDPAEYARLFAEVQNKVSGGISQAESQARALQAQIDMAEIQVDLLQTEIDLLTSSDDTLMSLSQAMDEYNKAKADLDNSKWDDDIAYYEDELARLESIDSSVMTLAQATTQYQLALVNAINSGFSGLGARFSAEAQGLGDAQRGSGDPILDLYSSIGRSGFGSANSQIDQAGYDYWASAAQSMSPETLSQAFYNGVRENISDDPYSSYSQYVSPYMGFADGGLISGPTTGFKMPDATFHGTEAIVPLQGGAIPVSMSGSGIDSEVKELLTVLISEVRTDTDLSKKIHRVLDRVTGGADSFQTRAEDA